MELDLIDKCICVCSKRNVGKSVLVKYLVSTIKDQMKKIYVVSGTEKINKFYSDLTNEENIFDDFDEDWTNNLIKKMAILNANKPKSEMDRVLLIFDDIMCNFRFHSSKALAKIVNTGRHLGLTCFFIFHQINQISPNCRGNCDIILCSKMSAAAIECLEHEFNSLLSKKEFLEMYHRVCQDYNFLVINQNGTKTNDPNEIYGVIRAPS